MNTSLATINSPQFINLTPLDINPLMSACEIKVLYVGENRNHSFITKEVATEMAKTLRGAPIVGYWRDDAKDFGDHGERVTLDVDGIKFECLTKPYGFVAPDAKVWFQEFEDVNSFGESVVREYLMTTGYLWTGQFEECKSVFEGEGKPHSMELDVDSLDGHWETNTKGMDFFIINDATFSKLCILGEDIEPCFEGSSVKAPEVSASFAKVDDTFKQTLFSMMQDLMFALKGGQQMDENMNPVVEEPVIETEAPVVEESAAAEPEVTVEETPAVVEDPIEEPVEPAIEEEAPVVAEEPVAEPVVEETVVTEPEAAPAPSVEEQFTALQAEHDELQVAYSNLETNHAELQTQFAELQAAHDALLKFQNEVLDQRKDMMIESFYMLSDDEKKEIVDNKSQYTVEEIEEKLSVICFRKGNFDLSNTSKNDNNTEAPVTTFKIDNVSGNSKPAWLSAVDNVKNKKY